MQVDVIEVQYEEMASKMKSVKTLQEAEQTLEDFLSACVIQSCLDVPMFSSLLSKTLAFCRTFCSLIQVELFDLEFCQALIITSNPNIFPSRLIVLVIAFVKPTQKLKTLSRTIQPCQDVVKEALKFSRYLTAYMNESGHNKIKSE